MLPVKKVIVNIPLQREVVWKVIISIYTQQTHNIKIVSTKLIHVLVSIVVLKKKIPSVLQVNVYVKLDLKKTKMEFVLKEDKLSMLVILIFLKKVS